MSPILARNLYGKPCTINNGGKQFLNQVSAWFLKIDSVQIVGMHVCVCVCVCVCVSAPEAINN